jgi:hypothetical protein
MKAVVRVDELEPRRRVVHLETTCWGGKTFDQVRRMKSL